jgi:hypothetical protein
MSLRSTSAGYPVLGKKNAGRGQTLKNSEDAPVPRILPIYPTRRLFVLVFMGDGERFVELFKRTWKKIPKQDRDLLLDQWKRDRKSLKRGS